MPTVKSNPAPAGTVEPAKPEPAEPTVFALVFNDKGQPQPPTVNVTAEYFGISVTASDAPLPLASALMAESKVTDLDTAHTYALWQQYKAELAVWQAENDGKAKLEALPEYKVYLAEIAAAKAKLDAATAEIPEIQAMSNAGNAVENLRSAVRQARAMRSDDSFATFIIPKRNTKGKADKA